MRSARPRAPLPPPGLRVGDYRLLAKIGEGGMGVVHLAQAPDGRRVALKVLRPHIIGDDEARERLAREVASLRRVSSPRIAEVLDADPWGPTPYVATRYVPGLSLHEHVRDEGPMSGADLRYFAAGLAEAVLAVHSVGVLHRDIKPSNVLLEGRAPVLIDFGLARLADDPRITVTGWLLGTPSYLAPEVVYGEDATTASDVHSWGATVAFAATGRPPFGRGPAMAVMDRVRRGEHDLSDVPPDILPLVQAAMALEPAARPTFPALLADLRSDRPRRGWLADDSTVPLALAKERVDDDPTDVLASDLHLSRPRGIDPVAATLVDGASVPPPPAVPPTRPLTQTQPGHAPQSRFAPARPNTGAPRLDGAPPRPDGAPSGWEPPANGVPRLQRTLLIVGLFALVAVGFAAVPYLSLAVIAATALALRTFSWTAEAVRERTFRRGPRWYDAPLAALTSPWYLLVATGGTVMLMLWSVALACLAGLALLLFRLPVQWGLVLMGGVLACALWWGPGARRLRRPVRSLVRTATRAVPLGWTTIGLLGVAGALCAYALVTSGVDWRPMPGAPWRQGTLLGDVLHWF